MSDERYSVYDAKARLSELVRKVRQGGRVVITYRGKDVAELVPYRARAESVGARVDRLEQEGTIAKPRGSAAELAPRAKLIGALGRFLDRRD